MRNGGDIADNREIETDRLKRANSRFASRARAFHAYLDFFKAVSHRLARRVLGDELSRIGRALSRTFESYFAGARPADDFSGQVGNGHDRIIKSRNTCAMPV